MAVPSPQLQQLLELGSKHMRLLAYMVAVSIFASGVYTGIYHPKIIALIPFRHLFLPMGSLGYIVAYLIVLPSQATAITLLLDGLITGLVLPLYNMP
jgi:adenylate cyclase